MICFSVLLLKSEIQVISESLLCRISLVFLSLFVAHWLLLSQSVFFIVSKLKRERFYL